MTDNIKKNKNQHDGIIEYEPKFDNKFILSSGTKDPLPVVTVSLNRGKKQRATIITSLTCLWDIGATNSVIKIRHTKPYKRKISPNKVEYSTAVVPYCMTRGIKVTFCMPYISSFKIVSH